MKLVNLLLSVTTAAVLLTGAAAFALEVGENAPCVVLDQTQNGVDSSHCIRDPQVEGRPVLIEFFSITCSDCIKNLPNLKALAKSLEGKATVRLVSIDRNEEKVRQFIKANRIEQEVAFDTDRNARLAYKVNVTPTLFILNQENVISEKHVGILTEMDQQKIIKTVEGL